MQLTELIAQAQAALTQHGDMDVAVADICAAGDDEPDYAMLKSTDTGFTNGYAPEFTFRLSSTARSADRNSDSELEGKRCESAFDPVRGN